MNLQTNSYSYLLVLTMFRVGDRAKFVRGSITHPFHNHVVTIMEVRGGYYRLGSALYRVKNPYWSDIADKNNDCCSYTDKDLVPYSEQLLLQFGSEHV